MQIDIFSHLNWAQYLSAICGVGVVVFTLISSNIQSKQTKIKDQQKEEISNKLILLQNENISLTKEIKNESLAKFDNVNAPDVRILSVSKKGTNYQVIVQNFGQRTAENVCLVWGYKYATEIRTTIQELPPNLAFPFTSEIFPLDALPAMQSAYQDIKKSFSDGNKSLLVDLTICYTYNNKPADPIKYTLIYTGQELRISRL